MGSGDDMSAAISDEETMAGSSMADDMSAGILPAWQTSILSDARTGQSFTLADFTGKTVFVDPMATWCSK